MTRRVSLGVDLDNTIVCYDRLFHRLASERELLPDSVAATKLAVRTHLRATGREDVWTELQGEAYGARMHDADEFPGCIEVLRRAVAAGIDVRIVSHRTRVPHRGAPHDLHRAAMEWLEGRGLIADRGIALRREHVHLELTRTAKCARIAALGCTHFIDDLPEVFEESTFPTTTVSILFDPDDAHDGAAAARRVVAWEDVGVWIDAEAARP